MLVILKYIITTIKEQKIRTAVMLLSIILASTLIFVSFSIGSSYEAAQVKMAKGMSGSASLSIAHTQAEGLIQVEEIPNLEGIKTKVGIMKNIGLYHEEDYYESIDLVAAYLEDLEKINKPRLEGNRQLTQLSKDEIVLPTRFTDKFNLQKGDAITLKIGTEERKFILAEIAAYDTVFLRQTRGTNGLISVETMEDILGTTGYNEILIENEDNVTSDQLKEQMSELLPKENYHIKRIVDEAQIQYDAREKSMPFLLISFFALTMSIFIIYSSYKVITLERLPAIGTFRSIGATRKQVMRMMILESLLYGVIGGGIGILVGLILLRVILTGMGQSLSQGIEIPIVISGLGLSLSLFVAIGVSVLSAFIPIYKTSYLPIKEIISGRVEEEKVSKKLIMGMGSMIFIASIILPNIATDKGLYLFGGLSLVGLIVSSIVIIPLLTNAVARGLEWIFEKTIGNEGKIAARNMQDNKGVIQNITLLFISLSAIIVITVMGSFVRSYIGDVFRGADIDGFADAPISYEFIEEVESMEGIEKVLPLYVMNHIQATNGSHLERLEGISNIEWYTDMFAITYTQSDRDTIFETFKEGHKILLSETFSQESGYSLGSTITLNKGDNQYEYEVIGIFKSRANNTNAVITSQDAEKDFGVNSYGMLTYTAKDPEAIMVQIRTLFGKEQNWSRTIEEFNQDALKTVGAFLRPMQSMTYFIVILSGIGIINNLLIQYIQKRRRMAMYKVIGMSNKQNVTMQFIEGISTGVIGASLAIFVAYMELQTIFKVAGPKIAMTPVLEQSKFMGAGILGIVITCIGYIVPIFKTYRMQLIEEIKSE
ncbi:MAG: FtsX-like permease family protein [Cellulosilyticum sp.]|nr:FtsX-like permease family protein [Cellulosilyticum sp.]